MEHLGTMVVPQIHHLREYDVFIKLDFYGVQVSVADPDPGSGPFLTIRIRDPE
jgi:hypothetical protein